MTSSWMIYDISRWRKLIDLGIYNANSDPSHYQIQSILLKIVKPSSLVVGGNKQSILVD